MNLSARHSKAVELLVEVFKRFEEIHEGYYLPYRSELYESVLGILAEEFSEEARFMLIEQISEVSKKCFGAPGAIEIFDNLGEANNQSWKLFDSVAPFYVSTTAPAKSDSALVRLINAGQY